MQGPSFEIDLRARTMAVERSDGRRLLDPLPDGILRHETNVVRFAVRAPEELLLIELPDGATATVELRVGRGVEGGRRSRM